MILIFAAFGNKVEFSFEKNVYKKRANLELTSSCEAIIVIEINALRADGIDIHKVQKGILTGNVLYYRKDLDLIELSDYQLVCIELEPEGNVHKNKFESQRIIHTNLKHTQKI